MARRHAGGAYTGRSSVVKEGPGLRGVTMELAEATIQRLLAKAREAQKNAYAPYSAFHVGAAVLAEDGRVFLGCNVENASYGLGVCAERNAIAATVVGGARPVAIAVVGPFPGVSPCGACRQVLVEFGHDLAVVLASAASPGYALTTSGALLPAAFTEESLQRDVRAAEG